MPLKLVLLELYLGTLSQFSDHTWKCGHTLFCFPDWWVTATMQISISYFQPKTGHDYFKQKQFSSIGREPGFPTPLCSLCCSGIVDTAEGSLHPCFSHFLFPGLGSKSPRLLCPGWGGVYLVVVSVPRIGSLLESYNGPHVEVRLY